MEEGSFSKSGADIGRDEVVEGERIMTHKVFRVTADGLQPEEEEKGEVITIRCLKTLPPDDAIGLLNGEDNTGLMIWDAGRLLLNNNLSMNPHPESVLELGCGLGLVSLCFSKIYKSSLVVTTDGNPECLSVVKDNIELNDLSTRAVLLLYGDESHIASVLDLNGGKKYELVTASDVIYSKDVVAPLFETVSQLTNTFVLSYIPRAWSDGENQAILEQVLADGLKHGFEPEIIKKLTENEITNTLYKFART